MGGIPPSDRSEDDAIALHDALVPEGGVLDGALLRLTVHMDGALGVLVYYQCFHRRKELFLYPVFTLQVC